MKCLILTLPLYVNYGGILQGWALQNIITDLGYNVEIINLPSRQVKISNLLNNLYHRVIALLKNDDRFYPVRLSEYLQYLWAFKKTRKFIKDQINHTSATYDLSDIHKINELNYDIYIVGSDQVWRSYYTGKNLDVYYLSFVKSDSLKIAYAASFGVDYLEYNSEEIEKYGRYYSLFDAVSVREASGIDIIQQYGWKINKPCYHVLDPTMLLECSYYVQKLSLRKWASSRCLFVYLLSKNTVHSIIDDISCELNMTVIESKLLDDNWTSIFKERMSPPEWLESIYNANFVITDSFHGCVFSIIFRKNFIVFCNNVRGNGRIQSLLKTFNLDYRLVVSNDDFALRKSELVKPIDYETVSEVLNKKRADSLKFLSDALANNM